MELVSAVLRMPWRKGDMAEQACAGFAVLEGRLVAGGGQGARLRDTSRRGLALQTSDGDAPVPEMTAQPRIVAGC